MATLLIVVAIAAALVARHELGSRAPPLLADPTLTHGAGGPILVVGSASNPSTGYYTEILRTEGIGSFAYALVGDVTAAVLARYDVVVLGPTTLTANEAQVITAWVEQGGNLIAMRPDPQLAGLLGIGIAAGETADAYLRADRAEPAGRGITGETMQFHGAAAHYTLAGATAVAMLYADAETATTFAAVTSRSVGSAGGNAAAFAYDLARSVIETRQGNPAWVGQRRDGLAGPIRPDNLFFGGARNDPGPDWVDFDKIEIPQADEQQRLLVNLITLMEAGRMPLPRYWYLPRGLKAAVVMTSDEHGRGDVAGRFRRYDAASPHGCSVADWQCVRGTSYMFNSTAVAEDELARLEAEGHEFGVHIDTGCRDFTYRSLRAAFARQLAGFQNKHPGLAPQVTSRTHCVAWSDWLSEPMVERLNGIRLDTSYYYYPGAFVRDRPGLFTGSGLPMRFADTDGQMIDVFQAATQMTDESGQTFPRTIEVLLDNALGETGYYGAFVANIHTDAGPAAERDADEIVAAAQARGVPVISARQLLAWIDARNASSFSGFAWRDGDFDFAIEVDAAARGLVAMLPEAAGGRRLATVTCREAPVTLEERQIKGVGYAMFAAQTGRCLAHYLP